MVNEEKVILMSKLASYEQGEGKKYVSIANYFRTDYISSQVLKSLVAGIIAFVAVIGVYLFYNFEVILENVYTMDLLGMATGAGKVFVVCIVIYMLLSYGLAVYRYRRARNSLKNYYNNLKRLEKF